MVKPPTRLDPGFARLLRRYKIDALEASAGTIFGVWDDFRLAYFNPAWFRFARDNGGEPAISTDWGLGASMLDAISADLRGAFAASFGDCLEFGVVDHQYECPSDLLYRRFHQIVYPLGQQEGLLIVNSLVVERPHRPAAKASAEIDPADYLDGKGLFEQCACCRRVRKQSAPTDCWELFADWVRKSPGDTSQTYCPTCASHYFPFADGKK